jgi:hypothetical protein
MTSTPQITCDPPDERDVVPDDAFGNEGQLTAGLVTSEGSEVDVTELREPPAPPGGMPMLRLQKLNLQDDNDPSMSDPGPQR